MMNESKSPKDGAQRKRDLERKQPMDMDLVAWADWPQPVIDWRYDAPRTENILLVRGPLQEGLAKVLKEHLSAVKNARLRDHLYSVIMAEIEDVVTDSGVSVGALRPRSNQ